MQRRSLALTWALGLSALAAPAGVATFTATAAGAHTSPAAPSATPFTEIRLGMKGERVKLLQQRLTKLGYPVSADGVYGTRTRAAVMKFQLSKGLVTDGIVGPRTWKALGLDTVSTTTTTTSTTTTTTTTLPKGGYRHPNPNVERWHDEALAAGWTEDQWPRLSCIIQRESKGIPTAKNPWSSAMGLLQIMWSAHSRWIGGSSAQLYDGARNLEIGRQLYLRAGGWAPWRSTVGGC